MLSIASAQSGTHSPETQPTKAIVRSNGTLEVSGRVHAEDYGSSHNGTNDAGPCGRKGITFSRHFYVADETNEKLLKLAPEIQKQLDTYGAVGDPKVAGGWYLWYSKIISALSNKWTGDQPGQMQVLMTVNRNRQISIEPLCFAPGTDRKNTFVTRKTAPEVEKVLLGRVRETADSLNESPDIDFPQGSTANRVTFLTTIWADHSTNVNIPDLRAVLDVPDDEFSQRVARMCSVFDSVGLSDVADHLRMHLPPQARHRFVPEDGEYGFVSVWGEYDGYYVSGPADLPQVAMAPEAISYLVECLETKIADRKLIEAEELSKAIAARFYWYNVMLRIQKENRGRPHPFPANPIAITHQMIQELLPRIQDEVAETVAIVDTDSANKLTHLPNGSGIEIRDRSGKSIYTDPSATTLPEALANASALHVSLHGASLRNTKMWQSNFGPLDLSDADFSGSKLTDVKFNGSDLSGATLTGANLRIIQADGVNFSNADLSGCNLWAANLKHADLRRANLRGANLSAAQLTGANCAGANFNDANLGALQASDIILMNAQLRSSHLRAANLQHATLTGANLENADLTATSLTYADCRNANFTKATCMSTDLTHSHLQHACFKEAKDISISVEGADLTDADLGHITKGTALLEGSY
jgi:uncharacterized protein YjbI with pentapeptide repeats